MILPGGLFLQGRTDTALFWSVLYRIGQQVQKDLLYPDQIPVNSVMAQITHINLQVLLLLFRVRADHQADLPHHTIQTEYRLRKANAA